MPALGPSPIQRAIPPSARPPRAGRASDTAPPGTGPIGIAAAVLLAIVALIVGHGEPRTIALLYAAAASPGLWLHDLREHRLPNRLVYPGYPVLALAAVGEWALAGRPPLVALASGAGYLLFLGLLHVAGGMGMGDVKLGGLLGGTAGLWGMTAAALSPLLAFAIGAVAGLAALVARRGKSIPFGPAMLAGFWIAVVVGSG